MTDIADGLRELAAPWNPGDRVKAAIERAARAAGFSYTRTFDLWYRKTRRVEDHEIAAVNDAIEKKRAEETRNELHELRTRLARLESLVAQKDPAFHRPTFDQMRGVVRKMG